MDNSQKVLLSSLLTVKIGMLLSFWGLFATQLLKRPWVVFRLVLLVARTLDSSLLGGPPLLYGRDKMDPSNSGHASRVVSTDQLTTPDSHGTTPSHFVIPGAYIPFRYRRTS